MASGALTLNGGTLQIAKVAANLTGQAISIGASDGTFNNNVNIAFSQAIGGSGGLTQSGAGSASMNGCTLGAYFTHTAAGGAYVDVAMQGTKLSDVRT